jgi:hypothetical protein
LIASKERKKRECTYRKGMNLDETLDDTEAQATKRKKSTTMAKRCEYCGGRGHLTQRSTKCKAKESTIIRYLKYDGSLLSESNLLVGAFIKPELLDAAYDSDNELPPPFFDEDDTVMMSTMV